MNPTTRHLAATSGARQLRQALFVTTDLACVTSSAFLAIALRFPETPAIHSHLAITQHTGISILYAALIVLFCHTQNLYTAYQTATWTSQLATILKSILYATLLLGSTLFITNIKITSRLIVAATALSAALTMTAWRQLLRRSLTRAKADGLSCHNVLIAGTNPLAQSLAQHLTHHPHFGLLLVGHLETMEDQTGGWGHSGRASELSQPSNPAGVSPVHNAPTPNSSNAPNPQTARWGHSLADAQNGGWGHSGRASELSQPSQTAGVSPAHTSSLANPQTGGWGHSGRASTLSQPSQTAGVSPVQNAPTPDSSNAPNPQTTRWEHSLADAKNGGWGHSGRASTLSQPSDPEGVSPAHTSSLANPQPAPNPLPTLGPATDLRTIARTHFIDELIICTNHRPTILHLLSEARAAGIGVRLIPDLYNAPNPRLDYLGDFPSLTLLHRHTPAIAITTKRLLDTISSFLALVLLSPLFLLIAAIIKLDSKGPIFYASQRIGKKGHTFPCLKFRTMVADAEARKAALQHLNERDGILFKITRDPRITRAGAFLRKHSLDELPQLWNVLKGDMSLVGPRPPLASEVKNYQLDHLRRLDVAPGITGLWQVEARNNPSFDRYIELDLKYVENWTLGLDLDILLRTVAVVLAGTGS